MIIEQISLLKITFILSINNGSGKCGSVDFWPISHQVNDVDRLAFLLGSEAASHNCASAVPIIKDSLIFFI